MGVLHIGLVMLDYMVELVKNAVKVLPAGRGLGLGFGLEGLDVVSTSHDAGGPYT
jgi:hypothetical protein